METMTLDKALEATIQILGDIQIPCALAESVGMPILRSISNLNQCIIAYREANEKKGEDNG